MATTPTLMATPVAGAEAGQWSRRALLRTLALVAAAGLLLVGGLVYAGYAALTSPNRGTLSEANLTGPLLVGEAFDDMHSGQERRDAIAAAPMLAVSPEAMRPGPPRASVGPAIRIPPAGRLGPAEVVTGFPQTPQGAIGQLAAIQTVVLQTMSIEYAHTVYSAWSEPSAPPVESWAMVANIQAFLGATAAGGISVGGTVVATPVAAQVKGSDGLDWTVACVLLQVRARIAAEAVMAYGHCERMQWLPNDGRWVIGAGDPPARAPSTWPETDLARQAGWRTWVDAYHDSNDAGNSIEIDARDAATSQARQPVTGARD